MLAPKTILSVFLLLFVTSTAFAASPFVKGELLVQQTLKATKANVEKAIKDNGGDVLEELPQIRVKRIRVPEKNFDKVKAALSKNPNFTFVEENFIAQGMLVPNDSYFSSQWHHNNIMSSSAWEMGVGSTEIPIAIIDSGVDPDHPDLMAKLLPGFNFLLGNSDTHDVLGHGTAVSGSAGALSNNATGVAGVAWNNPIMPLVVLNSSNWATYTDISNAIIYAVNNGAKVINISIGGSSFSSTLDNAVNYAWNNGVLVFASAANENTSVRYYPAACTNAVAVAATDSADNRASFSNYGDWITLAAPGVSILTTNNGGGYGYWSGTSFASPITAGLAALVWSANPDLTHQQILEILKSTADDLGATGFDNIYGYGRINAYNAMMEVMNIQPEPDTEPPSVALTSPSNNAVVSGDVSITATAADNVAVEKVEFRVNGTLLVADALAPFAATWDASSAASGYYTIEAKAFDSSGNTSLADTVQVVIEEVAVIDVEPPSVVLTSPSNNAVVSGDVSITATAADNVAVEKVEFRVNGTLVATDTVAPFAAAWDASSAAGGYYTIEAKAFDSTGNVSLADTVQVVVEEVVVVTDSLPPVVTILSPSNGATLTSKTTVTATASDEGGVVEMKIYVNGVLRSTKASDSIIWRWNTRKVSNGTYVIRIEAKDSAGNVGFDDIVLYK